MQTIALVIHVFLALGVIGLVLIQHGKGAEAGAAFGSGASNTVFGSRGSGSFLTRMTTFFALAFFCTSMLLFFLASQRTAGIGSVVDGIEAPTTLQQPVDVPTTENPVTDDVTQVNATHGDDVPAMPASESSTETDLPDVTPLPKSE